MDLKQGHNPGHSAQHNREKGLLSRDALSREEKRREGSLPSQRSPVNLTGMKPSGDKEEEVRHKIQV